MTSIFLSMIVIPEDLAASLAVKLSTVPYGFLPERQFNLSNFFLRAITFHLPSKKTMGLVGETHGLYLSLGEEEDSGLHNLIFKLK